MKYSNKRCLIVSLLFFILFTNIIFGQPAVLPLWFVFNYSNYLYVILALIFLASLIYFYKEKQLTKFLIILVVLFVVLMIIYAVRGELDLNNQFYSPLQ